ncbi:hypothetical protein EDD11_006179 [Mortierella claussenii]|nr:hypothetical protein EDD11_006179 [Mortierella claussenii]
MPLFRRQLMQQRTVHSSYKRRFYSNPAISSSSLSRNAVGSAVASSDSSSSAAASAVKKAVFSRGRHSGGATSFEVPGRAGSGADQESDIPINIQLGRLLIATKQHVQGLLDSFIYSGDNDPNLERVLMELLNGMLRSHSAFGSRDNISSQEQPMSFRPTMIRSLVHLRDLLSVTPTSASPISGSVSALSARLMEGPLLGVTRPRSSPLPPSRLSTSTLYPERIGVEADSDMEGEAPSDQQGGPEPILSASPGSSPLSLLDQERAIEMYHSTVEFLALMTAFVSIVCWLMQTMLGLKVSDFETSNDEGRDYRQKPDVGMDRESHQHTSRPRGGPLMNFLNLFDDRDNVLKPIMDALTYGTDLHEQLTHDRDNELGHDPAQRVGLYAWHFHLFGADPNSPLIKGGDTITEQHLQLHHFDVLLNELYTTHVLSISVKEHQKDHGQFYTPPNIVEFMWKRTFKGFGNMLDKFLEKTNSLLASDEPQVSFSRLQFPEPLIPTVLDPCLGVSTFLSEYVRLLIQEAHFEHDGAIWNSGLASRLLLHQICEHVWGIELDGFTFWMARCGVLAAMMPLVQRVQELAQSQPYFNTKSQLPRLCLFRNDTLKLIVPDGDDSESTWERERIFQLRNPTKLQFDFIVTNPPYMIRKTGTFSAPDPEVYDWTILGSSFAVGSGTAVDAAPTARVAKAPKLRRGRKKAALETFHATEEGVSSAVDTGDEAAHGYNESDSEVATPESSASAGSGSILSARAEMSLSSLNTRSQPKGMMQAYGYFIWFAAQRLKPYTGVSCMITASQWLTLEFAAKLRAWLFENCLMDEFFQFEPFKVFSKVQTDSLIFKIRSLGSAHDDISVREKALQDHRTIFLRHTDHHKPLEGILQDYMNYRLEDVSGVTSGLDSSPDPNDLSLSIMVSYKTRQELSAAISAPPVSFLPASASMPSGGISKTNSSNEPTTATDTTTASATSATPIPTATWTYSFAPMMPSSGLTTYLLALTQDLGGICSPGTKKVNRLSAPEPLLWHRGPNTNPVYGLVTRMEFALANFGPAMAERWFKPALYWNGKNSPDEGSGGPGGGTPSSSKAMHKEGLFWHTRDRLRLSKKEGSPAESYVVPKPDPQRVYALCMVDKESVKVLKQQMQQGVHGSLALWDYLTDVRTHFQPGLATKKRKVASGGKQQDVNDDGVAFCSTNQCGSDVPEKIIHPINYGYFSKTQPRQRFFLDTHSLAVTNQCIYLTLNMISHHYDADQSPPLVYFLTLLNSSTLQFFVLHYCQYDQQGRMRLFRESMAKIPFQDRDVKLNPERTRYASRLGELMLELKGLLYNVVTQWQLTGSGGYHHHGYGHGYGHVGNTSSRRGSLPSMNISGRGTGIGRGNNRLYDSSLGPGGLSGTPGSSNHGLLDWVRRGGDAPTGVLIRTRDQIHRMLVSAAMTTAAETSQLDPGPAGRPATNNSPPVSQPFSMSSIARGVRSSGVVLTDTDSDTNTGTDTESDVDDHSVTQLHLGGDGGDIAGREYGLGSELDSPRRISKEVTDFGDLTAMAMDPPRRPHPLASSGSDASMAPIAAAHSSSSSSLPLAQLPPDTSDLSLECDKIMQAIERVVAMVEMVQWAVDQYGYMLYGIRPKFQKLLELELKIVYSSLVDSLIAPSSPITSAAVSERTLGPNPNEALPASRPQQPLHQPTSIEEDKQKPGVHLPQPQSQSRQVPGGGAASRLGITVFGLHRWDDCDTNAAADNSDQQQQQRSSIPVYGSTVFENARTAIDHLQRFLHRYPLA